MTLKALRTPRFSDFSRLFSAHLFSPWILEGVRFADAWRERVATDFDGVPGQVIGRKHLITNKRAIGRPQDLMDVTNLLESERVGEKPPQVSETPKKKRPKGRDRGMDR